MQHRTGVSWEGKGEEGEMAPLWIPHPEALIGVVLPPSTNYSCLNSALHCANCSQSQGDILAARDHRAQTEMISCIQLKPAPLLRSFTYCPYSQTIEVKMVTNSFDSPYKLQVS